jgi:pilus assembly protein CpaF
MSGNVSSFGRRGYDLGAQPGPLSSAQSTDSPPAATPQLAVSSADKPRPGTFQELRTLCLARLDPSSVANVPPDRLAAEIERLISEIATARRIQLNGREQRTLAEELVDDMLGMGPLEPLLEDDSIADIMVNGPDRVFIERRGKVTLSNVHFRDAAHVVNICQRIATGIGRRVDEASPMVDARLKDGSRVNIVMMPLALVEFGALSGQVARILEIAGRARLNIVISGGTGSGKTTMMNAISRLIDPGERVVTIEDAAELQLQQPHVVRLETRPASLEGRGEVTQRDLVRNALRMRPDRVIIGEVRGGEAFDMLQAMNTGHDGSMSTIHANNTRDALSRVENMVQMGNVGLPSRAIRQQIVSAVDIIVQLERQRDGGRRVTQVTEVVGMEGEVVTLNDVFQLEFTGEGPDGKLNCTYKVSGARPACHERLSYFGMDRAWKAALESKGE